MQKLCHQKLLKVCEILEWLRFQGNNALYKRKDFQGLKESLNEVTEFSNDAHETEECKLNYKTYC